MYYFTTSNEIMYADVPTTGTRTLYARVGDVFAWLCVAGFVALIMLSICPWPQAQRLRALGNVRPFHFGA
jgi:apolipoprotein N-acyltransferase